MANHFYAYISRMRCVKRWALMRNTEEENIQDVYKRQGWAVW